MARDGSWDGSSQGSALKIHCLFDELKDPFSLRTHPKNRNKHPADQIKRLADILEFQGWRYAIKVSKLSGYVTSGHGRIQAALSKGWNQVPVVYQDYDSEEQEYADVQADNAIASWAELDLAAINLDIPELGPDFEIDLLGIKDFVLEPADKYADQDADAVPETRKTKIKPGDLFQLGNHRLLCGDATSKEDVERLMNGEKADMVFTDPPYGINEETDRAFASGTRLAKGNSFKKIEGDDSIETALNAFKVIDSKIICYWGGNYFAHELPASPCWIIWDKRVEENQRDMNSDCEMAWVSHPSKKSVRIFRHLWKGMIKGSEVGEGRCHPTQKPIALAEWCFNELDPSGSTVLDLFLGSGSTLIACEKTNRKCFGMEIDPHYCQVIIDRYEKFAGHKAKQL